MTHTNANSPQQDSAAHSTHIDKASVEYLYRTYFGPGQIEKDEIDSLPALLKGVDVFVDVGASFGMYTFYANATLENAEIIALEADGDRYAELERNAQSWQSESSNSIQALLAAAGNDESPIVFYRTGTHISGALFEVSERADAFYAEEVQQVKLDSFLREGQHYLVKIDVEGAELRVLEGAQELLRSRRARFLVGIHSWGDKERGKTPLSVLRFMFKHRMDIARTGTSMTANYLFTPSERNQTHRALQYLRYTPMLFARQTYRMIAPRKLARWLEIVFSRHRRKKITQTSSEG